MVHRQYRRGDNIWLEGAEAEYIAIVVSGAVKLVKTLPDGREQIVGLLLPTDCVGYPFSEERVSHAVATDDTELCCFPMSKFENAISGDPAFEHALLERTYSDLIEARDWLIAVGRLTAEEKVAHFLLWLMEKTIRSSCEYSLPEINNPVLYLPLNRSEIADFLGITIETVSRHFTKLRNADVIKVHEARVVEITDTEKLRRLAGADSNPW